jgi:hypothetical protein
LRLHGVAAPARGLAGRLTAQHRRQDRLAELQSDHDVVTEPPGWLEDEPAA